jgi:hypothetical protein
MDKLDDPPVYVNIKFLPERERDKWVLCCDTFSTFIFTRLFDFRYWCDKDLSIEGSGKPLKNETIKNLREIFDEYPTTYGFPGDAQYRFGRNDQRILICTTPNMANWYFTAETTASVLDVFEKYKTLLSWHTDLPGS